MFEEFYVLKGLRVEIDGEIDLLLDLSDFAFEGLTQFLVVSQGKYVDVLKRPHDVGVLTEEFGLAHKVDSIIQLIFSVGLDICSLGAERHRIGTRKVLIDSQGDLLIRALVLGLGIEGEEEALLVVVIDYVGEWVFHHFYLVNLQEVLILHHSIDEGVSLNTDLLAGHVEEQIF